VPLIAALALLLLALTSQSGRDGPSVTRFLEEWAVTEASAKTAKPGDKVVTTPEMQKMMGWIGNHLTRYATEVEFAEVAGTPKRACLPPKGQREFTTDTFVPFLRSLPQDKRGMPIEQALYQFMDVQYPCP
jgi:hypothetical protein